MTAPTPPPEELRGTVEELVRSYLTRAMRRYVPFIVGLATLGLLIALVPSVSPNTPGGFSAQAGASGSAGSGGAASGGASAGGASGPVGASGSAGGASAGGLTGSGGLAGSAASSGNLGPGVSSSSGGSVASPAPSGARVSVDCSRRQISWSYNGPCVTAFTGPNGGTTAPGVSASQIVASFRLSTAGESAAVEALASGANQKQAQVLADLQVYVNYFNTQFQLYGRKVVLKSYTGQGDWLQEYQGQDLAAAQADAATAKGLGAFMDLSPAASSESPPYCSDLAQQRILCAGGVVETNHYMQQYYPYAESPTATLDYLAYYWAAEACQRMAGMPAVFAGDALYQHQTRKFGVIALEEPDYDSATNYMINKMNACGASVVRKASYSINVPTLEQQDTNIIAQMKAAGATTIVCVCDTISPTLLTTAAVQQAYYPEWMSVDDGDNYGQERQTSEWSHALMTGGTKPAFHDGEDYKVFKLADPTGEPQEAEPWLALTYYAALVAFSSIQQAGPDLTPTSFVNGLFSLPASLPGAEKDGLPWAPGKGIFAPLDEAPIGYFDVNATSPDNGMKGTTVSCSGFDGTWHPVQSYAPSAYGPAHTQLHCYGK